MSEEKEVLSPALEEQAPPRTTDPQKSQEKQTPQDASRRSSRGQQRRRQRSVFQYIAILFAAAFVLLLFTYMMERRENKQRELQDQEQIEDLNQQTVSAVQTLQGLYDENAALKDQVADLEDQLKALTEKADELESSAGELNEQLEATRKALDWFWQIDEAYVRGRTTQCRELISSMEESGLQEYLPRESITDNDRYSPYDRFMEIREAVM